MPSDLHGRRFVRFTLTRPPMPATKRAAPEPHDFVPLTPATYQVLLALHDGEQHGYAIMRMVNEVDDGGVRLGPGTLYGTLKRLLDTGLVLESDERADPDDPAARRRYYRLTALGGAVLRAEARRMDAIVRTARAKKLLRPVRA